MILLFIVACGLRSKYCATLIMLLVSEFHLPYPLARDEPGPFNFWTFVMKCSTRMLTYCSTPYLTLPGMQLNIV